MAASAVSLNIVIILKPNSDLVMVTGSKQPLKTACCYRYFEFEAIWRTRAVILNFIVILKHNS